MSAAPSQSGGANYINVSEANITFTGNVTNDFSGHQIYENTHATPWGGPDNNLTALYVSFNSTYLFIGVKEIIDGNSLMVFLSNDTNTQYGTYNMTNLNTWNRAISFTSPVNYFAAVYFGGPNSDPSGEDAFMVNSPLSASNTSPSAVSIQNYFVFGGSNNTVEIRIPWQALFPYGYSGTLHMNISAFIVGGSGAWVGIGMPYSQVGKYNDGNSISEFVVNDTIGLNFGQVNIPSTVKTTTPPTAPPINLAIIFNDHQPLYKVVGSNYYVLPWTEAHATAEYIEQALIAHMFPEVNVTYELSGSLLYQLVNISTDPEFNDTFIHYAFVPYSELNTTQNRSLLANLTYDYFSIPSYVFSLNEPASNLYAQLHSLWVSGKTLNATQFEDAKVLWFLYDVSTPLVEGGQLGAQWKNSTIWALHNQTSFNQTDLKEILQYSKWLTGQVIPAFRSDMQGNTSGSNNVELFTSPFYHPLTPLLLANNLTGPAGTIYKASYFSDVLAQMNISRGGSSTTLRPVANRNVCAGVHGIVPDDPGRK
ncbi:hypothetical protein [Thermogymnomonas acidicola]|uniref:hypothetical protein n=1 Tax=Thermogymnomonas acidicola TaxID=399579 RepID=UPI0009467FE0|nr:hypothetical protein [Thermogymnomonas acidicola]